jgi:hypothetical protein
VIDKPARSCRPGMLGQGVTFPRLSHGSTLRLFKPKAEVFDRPLPVLDRVTHFEPGIRMDTAESMRRLASNPSESLRPHYTGSSRAVLARACGVRKPRSCSEARRFPAGSSLCALRAARSRPTRDDLSSGRQDAGDRRRPSALLLRGLPWDHSAGAVERLDRREPTRA